MYVLLFNTEASHEMDTLFDLHEDDLSLFLEESAEEPKTIAMQSPVSSSKYLSKPNTSSKVLGKKKYENEEIEEGEIIETVCNGFYFDIGVMKKVQGCIDCNMGRTCNRK